MSDVLLHDSLGDIRVPAGALYGPQTQRAVENFTFSNFRFPRPFLRALALIKKSSAEVNGELNLLDGEMVRAIVEAADQVEGGEHDNQFPLDIFQTGSGTSTNMNANEGIATLASRICGKKVHPNDHVNLGQSSNDVIPATIHLSAAQQVKESLLPAIDALAGAIAAARIESAMPRILELPLGGTAIGTGLNADPSFGALVVNRIAKTSGLPFTPSRNLFASISSQDASLELSAQLRGLAVSLLKIANDLRWMNSGPVSGLAEISLQALQPGSSIMPGKVNPVIPEAVAMICAQTIGNDTAIMIAAQSGAFQLNTMLPVIAWNLLSSIHLLSGAAEALGSKAIASFAVNEERLRELAAKNPILATALAPKIGYDRSAEIAKEVVRTGRPVIEVAMEKTSLSEEELSKILDPAKMTGEETRITPS
jgi:fumarate hydratase, class II